MRKMRPTYFVCASVSNGQLLTKTVCASTPNQASEFFQKENFQPPQQVLGPFYKKRSPIKDAILILKFSSETKRAHYNDWLVSAILLTEPVDQAYLIFIKRLDGKKISPPQGTITVPISQLTFVP
jgi:hypothetical protein